MACPMFATLADGVEMPLLGYGTYMAGGEDLEAATTVALECGYRHIDTAAFYANEAVIGNSIKKWIEAGKGSREDLFLTTKVPPCGIRPAGVHAFLERSLLALDTDYVDLLLLHVPFAFVDNGEQVPMGDDGNVMLDLDTDHVAIWKAMEEELEAGRVKAIGVSNFNQRQLQRILDNCRIKPVNLQLEAHVYMQQQPLFEFCKENGISLTAYSPLGNPSLQQFYSSVAHEVEVPSLLTNPVVTDIAAAQGKTPAQVLLRFLLQRGMAAIPKSTNEARIKENIQLFDFELSSEDMVKLVDLDRGDAGRIFDMLFVKGIDKHPEYPW